MQHERIPTPHPRPSHHHLDCTSAELAEIIALGARVAGRSPHWRQWARVAQRVIGSVRYAEVLAQQGHVGADWALAEANLLLVTPLAELDDVPAVAVLAAEVESSAGVDASDDERAVVPAPSPRTSEWAPGDIIDMAGACAITRRSPSTLRRWIRDGRLTPTQRPPYGPGTRYTFVRAEVERARDRSPGRADVIDLAALDARATEVLRRRR